MSIKGKLHKYSIKLEIISYSPGFFLTAHPLYQPFSFMKYWVFELSRVQCQFTLCAQSLNILIHGHILYTASTEMTTKLSSSQISLLYLTVWYRTIFRIVYVISLRNFKSELLKTENSFLLLPTTWSFPISLIETTTHSVVPSKNSSDSKINRIFFISEI